MIPNKVKVAGIEYVVEFPEFVEIDGSRNYQGSASFRQDKIKVLNSLSKQRQEQVFVHELVHAIFNEAGYEEDDEDMVNRLGIVLYQVLKDNKIYFGEDE